jgi:MFS family permease
MISLLLQGWFNRVVGKVRLMVVLEVMSITVAILYTIENLNLLMGLRVLTGMIGGLSIGTIPVICVDLFPSAKASLGSCLSYVFIVIPILIAGLQDPINGGKAGLEENWKLVFWAPVVFGSIRLLLVALFLAKIETPQFWIDNFKGEDKELKKRLDSAHKVIFTDEDSERLSVEKIQARNTARANNIKAVGLKDMFTKKYRKRFLLGCLLNTFQ